MKFITYQKKKKKMYAAATFWNSYIFFFLFFYTCKYSKELQTMKRETVYISIIEVRKGAGSKHLEDENTYVKL